MGHWRSLRGNHYITSVTLARCPGHSTDLSAHRPRTFRLAAQDAAYRLVLLGLDAVAPPDSYTQANVANRLDPKDACLVISHTGSTRDSLAAATSAKEAGSRVVLISSYGHSPIGVIADSLLVADGHEQGFQLEAMSSRLAHIAVVDALFVGVALADERRARAALNSMATVTAERSL
jgi:RpiR family transcriptional regulator, carbohydrate utilization regulator